MHAHLIIHFYLVLNQMKEYYVFYYSYVYFDSSIQGVNPVI